ncbi:MAG: baseplate J/gp47 family protein [Candidatus Cardinium sp.]|nr:baseplate J/gp47 family protein [Candidatus Cardinium sp.]
MNIQKKFNILFNRTGICQAERLLPELIENDLLISDKKLSDYLRFIYLYSDLLVYYDTNNQPMQANVWRKFLEQDDTVMCALILHTNIDGIKGRIQKKISLLRSNSTSMVDHKQWIPILETARDLVILLNYWHKNLPNEDIVRVKLDTVVHEVLNKHISILYKLLHYSGKNHGRQPFIDFCLFLEEQCAHTSLWKLNRALIYNEAGEVHPDDSQVIDSMDDFFDASFNTVYQLKELASNNYLHTLQLQNKEPHVALLIAFLQLLQYADAHLNHLPQRFLVHYYRHILKFNNNPATPDQAYLHFLLNPNYEFAFIPEGSRLIAKNPLNDEQILFEVKRNITINKAKIKQISSLFPKQRADKSAHTAIELAAITYANEQLKKLPFQLFPVLQNEESEKPHYQVATLLASPLFYLAEGLRSIQLKWKFTAESFQAFLGKHTDKDSATYLARLSNILHSSASIQVTTKMGWFGIAAEAITLQWIAEAYCLHMVIVLGQEVPAISKLPAEYQGPLINPAMPAVAIVIPAGVSITDLSLFNALLLERIDIKVSVQNYRGLILQNQLGIIDNSQVIEPFGPLPKIDSSFYIGSGEIFAKPITSLKIDIKWENIPNTEDGFKHYYEGYPTKIDNEDFKVNISYLNHQHWNPSPAANRQHIPLFQVTKCSKGIERLDSCRSIHTIDIAALNITKAQEPLDLFTYNPKTIAGFLKLQLSGPAQAFGHAIYPSLLNKVLVHNAQQKKESVPLVLNEPYTPRIKAITVDYEAEETIACIPSSGEVTEQHGNSFFHISSFGYVKVLPSNGDTAPTLLPLIEKERTSIAFGIADLNSTSCSMHIAMGEEPLGLDQAIQPPSWFYLSSNRWLSLKEAIVVDGTNGCTQSGIIVFDLGKLLRPATKDNTLMPAGLIWIKAQFSEEPARLTPIMAVYLQAVAASRVMDKQGVFAAPVLPAHSILQLQHPIEGIDAVRQPIQTFGGRQFENHQAFYRRVSERLRHKNRAISAWDYEHMILEKFPEIYRVKCLNHTLRHANSMVQPGCITFVVIAKRKHGAIGMFPKASRQLLTEIKTYLQSIHTPFVQCAIVNPMYEDIKVNVTVKFNIGYEKGLFLNLLQEDLRQFLSPWLFDPSADMLLGGDMPASKIIDFINSRSYIEGIGNFSIFKYVGSGSDLKLDKISNYDSYLRPSYPWSIMISAKNHKIESVDTFEGMAQLRHGSLGDMAIGEDFIIGPFDNTNTQLEESGAHQDPDILIPSLEEHYLVTQKHIRTDHGYYE